MRWAEGLGGGLEMENGVKRRMQVEMTHARAIQPAKYLEKDAHDHDFGLGQFQSVIIGLRCR